MLSRQEVPFTSEKGNCWHFVLLPGNFLFTLCTGPCEIASTAPPPTYGYFKAAIGRQANQPHPCKIIYTDFVYFQAESLGVESPAKHGEATFPIRFTHLKGNPAPLPMFVGLQTYNNGGDQALISTSPWAGIHMKFSVLHSPQSSVTRSELVMRPCSFLKAFIGRVIFSIRLPILIFTRYR